MRLKIGDTVDLKLHIIIRNLTKREGMRYDTKQLTTYLVNELQLYFHANNEEVKLLESDSD